MNYLLIILYLFLFGKFFSFFLLYILIFSIFLDFCHFLCLSSSRMRGSRFLFAGFPFSREWQNRNGVSLLHSNLFHFGRDDKSSFILPFPLIHFPIFQPSNQQTSLPAFFRLYLSLVSTSLPPHPHHILLITSFPDDLSFRYFHYGESGMFEKYLEIMKG